MKKIEAFIRHEAFEPIRMELLELGFPSLSISEVKGSGRQKGITERYRGAELTNWLRPKVKLECVVASGDVQTVVDAILKHARTGSIGDGKVFILPVEEAYRIRTGESGEETLQAHPGVAAQAASVAGRPDHTADFAGRPTTAAPRIEGGVLNVAMEVQPEDRGTTVMERVQGRAPADGGRGPERRRSRGRGHAGRRRDRRGRGDRRSAPRRGGGLRTGRRPRGRCAGTWASGLASRAAAVPAGRGGRGADRYRRRAARRGAAARRGRAGRRTRSSSCTSPRWRA